ncbi:unnamed protein product, partial [Rotaria magnacalcarata]
FRIHTSETTADLLEILGGFNLEFRGVTEIKVNIFTWENFVALSFIFVF